MTEPESVQTKAPIDQRLVRSLIMVAWVALVVFLVVQLVKSRDPGAERTGVSVLCVLGLVAMFASAAAFHWKKTRREPEEPEGSASTACTAVLVVHGMGVHDRYQMLDDFARAIPTYTQLYAGIVKTLKVDPKNDYIPLNVDGWQIDVHEAYWGHLFNRLTKLPRLLVFSSWTLVKFAPTLFTRFYRKRLAEAAFVGLALFVLYLIVASTYAGGKSTLQKFEMLQIARDLSRDGSIGAREQRLLNEFTSNRENRPLVRKYRESNGIPVNDLPFDKRWEETGRFVRKCVSEAFSFSAFTQPVPTEYPLKMLAMVSPFQLLVCVVYCAAVCLQLVYAIKLVAAQAKYWSSGRNGPKGNDAYEERVNEEWTKSSWSAIKGGIFPIIVFISVSPWMDLLFVHLVSTVALLIVTLKGLAWWVEHYLGDVMIYATQNANAVTFEAREKATELVSEKLEALLDDEKLERVIVVAHSLGSVIATNAIRRTYNRRNGKVERLAAFVTIGSPLRKFRQLFKAEKYKWAFGDNAIAHDQKIFIGEEYDPKDRVPWFNYWYGTDVFADRLAYEPWGELKDELLAAAVTRDQAAYNEAVIQTIETDYDELDNTGFRVGDRRDCNLGPRAGLWTHSDYWLDYRFVDDLIAMCKCDRDVLQTMSVALKPTLAPNKRS